jgi:uridine kinase
MHAGTRLCAGAPESHALTTTQNTYAIQRYDYIMYYVMQVPIYDFKSSKRVGFTSLDVPESRVVIIEGIYALSERLKPLLDLRVSITGEWV